MSIEHALLSVIRHFCGSFWVKIAIFLMHCLHQLIVFKLRWYDCATRPIENTGTKIFSLVDLLLSLYTMVQCSNVQSNECLYCQNVILERDFRGSRVNTNVESQREGITPLYSR